MNRLTRMVAGAVVLLANGPPSGEEAVRASANDNRRPAGAMRGDTLVLRLVVRTAEWYPEAENGPHITIQAFAEEGQLPSIPAPLIRAESGTTIRATIRNALTDSTIHLIGLGTQPIAPSDTLHVAPGTEAEVTFRAGTPGTYIYRAVIGNDPDGRPSERETAVGAFVVDPVGGSPPDRIFVVNVIALESGPRIRQAIGFNGKSWPFTERVPLTVGDTVRWRIVNGTTRGHPVHLHGFYFRLDAAGDGRASRTIPPAERWLGVTEQVQPWGTRTLTWSPDRPGNWLFHCHLTFHVTPEARLDHEEGHGGDVHSADPVKHMAGLVIGIPVRPRPGESYARTGEPRRLDLFFQQGGRRGSIPVTYSFVLQRGSVPPAPDSVEVPGSPIVVTRGTATDIVVHNRAREHTAVHWHGLELESWSDGVAGWSGGDAAMAPPIVPGDSFVARLTLPRAGTFIYHTHLNDIEQVTGGAAGPLIVLEPGERFDPSRDHVYLSTWEGRPPVRGALPNLLINGDSSVSPTRELAAGVLHRFRFINIGAAGIVRFSLSRDTALAEWRRRAKDGADLPEALRQMQPAAQVVAVGETYDFEFLPPAPGTYRLRAVSVVPPGLTSPARPWSQQLIVRDAPGQVPPQADFWARLTALCGKAFAGRVVDAPAGDTSFANRALVMHVRSCGADTIRIPFHVDEDRSRTWVITRAGGGLRLKHDHRHADGAPDSVTQYGGDARLPGSAGMMEFPADAFTAGLIPPARTNVWTIEVDPRAERFVYALRREGTNRRFRIEFDLGREVAIPPPPWGS
jgi:manganese oxidase